MCSLTTMMTFDHVDVDVNEDDGDNVNCPSSLSSPLTCSLTLTRVYFHKHEESIMYMGKTYD